VFRPFVAPRLLPGSLATAARMRTAGDLAKDASLPPNWKSVNGIKR
jgi:hypothetical protein